MHGSDDETDNEMAAPHLENTQHAPGTGSKPIKSANGSVRLRSMPCHEIQRGRHPPPNTGRQGGLDKTWPSHGSACLLYRDLARCDQPGSGAEQATTHTSIEGHTGTRASHGTTNYANVCALPHASGTARTRTARQEGRDNHARGQESQQSHYHLLFCTGFLGVTQIRFWDLRSARLGAGAHVHPLTRTPHRTAQYRWRIRRFGETSA